MRGGTAPQEHGACPPCRRHARRKNKNYTTAAKSTSRYPHQLSKRAPASSRRSGSMSRTASSCPISISGLVEVMTSTTQVYAHFRRVLRHTSRWRGARIPSTRNSPQGSRSLAGRSTQWPEKRSADTCTSGGGFTSARAAGRGVEMTREAQHREPGGRPNAVYLSNGRVLGLLGS